ncbi:CpaF family protein [Fictibacillus phosphorivorans]|uniref:CpaF family protein n=1 Tax=Fictibacillus phosphorivorans TaxID=1221500 RepID=UPI00203A8A1B|nr:CpaF family protein [Fictibacillus phosphorivorans]MCM3719810.1 CpaF family protein [Fictibacillus phosphorivorans]MCM3777519.1 CpaF family protein [Fictibacillus phosphorivorans]
MSIFKREKELPSLKKTNLNNTYSNPYIDKLVEHYKGRLLHETNLEQLTSLSRGEMKLSIEKLVSSFMSEEKVIIPRHEKEALLIRLIDESVGFGPLEPLLNDSEITEILINGHKEVFIEKNGQLRKTNIQFKDENHVRHIVDRVVAPLGRRIDESSPMVDARLHDGSRVNAVIPPVSLNGTLVSIRKFREDPFKMEDLINFQSMDESMSHFLQAVIKAKMNVLISGGTGSGKTTLLNALARAIPPSERVITIEDSAELKLDRASVVGMESRPPNVEGSGEITIRQLVKNALRMRPDRIIVGEVRGSEAFDMLQAMNTGHEGSMTTVHANSPYDALSRVEGMVIMSGMDLPTEVIREYIVGALDFIVQGERLSDGNRKIVSIAEVFKDEQNKVQMKEIFKFKRTGMGENGKVLGYFTPTGTVPKCLERLRVFGIKIDESMFWPKEVKPNDTVYSV